MKLKQLKMGEGSMREERAEEREEPRAGESTWR